MGSVDKISAEFDQSGPALVVTNIIRVYPSTKSNKNTELVIGSNFINQINLSPAPEYYEPCSHFEIITRNLRNLLAAFEKQGDTQKMEEVKQMLDVFGKTQQEEQ